jgi:hypothetical protein
VSPVCVAVGCGGGGGGGGGRGPVLLEKRASKEGADGLSDLRVACVRI